MPGNYQQSTLNNQQWRKFLKYPLLLSIKESYLLSRNIFGLYKHPFKTIRAIFREKDYSQLALILGMPFYTLLAGVIFIFSGRFLIGAPAALGWLAKILLVLLALLSLLSFTYLSFWIWKIWRLRK